MRYPQLLVYETDGRQAELLREPAKKQKWVLREPRQLEACLKLLGAGGPAILVIKVGRDLVRELTLLERVHDLCPDTVIVVAGDTDDLALGGLAWDLGASLVLSLPHATRQLPEILTQVMEKMMASQPGGVISGEPPQDVP